MSYRGRMPPLSYLTMLDVILLVNLGLLSVCVLIIVGSAVILTAFELQIRSVIISAICEIISSAFFSSSVSETAEPSPLGGPDMLELV